MKTTPVSFPRSYENSKIKELVESHDCYTFLKGHGIENANLKENGDQYIDWNKPHGNACNTDNSIFMVAFQSFTKQRDLYSASIIDHIWKEGDGIRLSLGLSKYGALLNGKKIKSLPCE